MRVGFTQVLSGFAPKLVGNYMQDELTRMIPLVLIAERFSEDVGRLVEGITVIQAILVLILKTFVQEADANSVGSTDVAYCLAMTCLADFYHGLIVVQEP